MHGPIGKKMLDGLQEYGLQGLAFFSCGFRNVFTKGVAVMSPGDLKGMKIRVTASPVMIDSLNSMGASATPLSASELFQSLKTGVVDGAENNPVTFVSDKYYEAGCDHFCMTGHFANQHFMVANKKWLAKVAQEHPDLHELILKAPAAIMDEYQRRWDVSEKAAMQEIKDVGVTIVTENEVDKAAFVKTVETVIDDFFKKNPDVDREYITLIREAAKSE